MGIWWKYLPICLFLVLPYPVLAEPPNTPATSIQEEAAREEARRLEIVVRVQSILLEMGETAERDARANGPLTDGQWEERIREAAREALFAHLDERATAADRNRLSEFVRSLNWRSMVQIIRRVGAAVGGVGPTISNVARTHGIPGVAALVVGTALNVAVPPVLMMLNMAHLVPLSIAAPYGTGVYAVARVLQQRLLRARLIQLYGGQENYDRAMTAQAAVRRQLGLRGNRDFVVQLFSAEHGHQGAVVSESSLVGNLLARAGWSQQRLTYENLLAFLRRAQPDDPMVEAIANNRTLSKEVKTTMLLHYANDLPDGNLHAALRRQFSESFVRLPALHESLARQVTDWVEQFALVRSPEEIGHLMARAPRDAQAATIARIWSDLIVPTLVRNIPDITIAQARALTSSFVQLQAEAQLNGEARWDQSWAQKFDLYFARIFPRAAGCHGIMNAAFGDPV